MVDAADCVVWRNGLGTTYTQGDYSTWRAHFGQTAARPPLPGDYNSDNTVDAADYVVWRKGLGTTYTQDDYNTWRPHFGQTAGSGAIAAVSSRAVPEPPTPILFIAALLAMLTYGCRDFMSSPASVTTQSRIII